MSTETNVVRPVRLLGPARWLPAVVITMTSWLAAPATAQEPAAVPAPDAQSQDLEQHLAQLDSLRAAIQRASEEQMAAIRRVTEDRQAEMDLLRAELAARSQGLQAAQRELTEAERQLADTQRGEIEEVRTRLLEESRRLSEAANELARLQGSRGSSSASRTFEFSSDGRGYVVADALYGVVNPFSLGMRALSGAELTEMNPSLARYFDVDGGILVTDVADGSQAAEAGLQGGDVIVTVDGEPIDDVSQLREAVSGRIGSVFLLGTRAPPAGDPNAPVIGFNGVDVPESVTLGIVREGREMEIELRRE